MNNANENVSAVRCIVCRRHLCVGPCVIAVPHVLISALLYDMTCRTHLIDSAG